MNSNDTLRDAQAMLASIRMCLRPQTIQDLEKRIADWQAKTMPATKPQATVPTAVFVMRAGTIPRPLSSQYFVLVNEDL